MSIVVSSVSIKRWMSSSPTVASVRPPRCPACDRASRVFGASLCLIGHGLRSRIVRGPLDVDGDAPPDGTRVICRRFRCKGCDELVAVVPCGVLPRRHFFGPAIALALYLFGAAATPVDEIRDTIGGSWPPEFAEPNVWRTLAIWIRAAADGRIFSRVGRSSCTTGLRVAASTVASAIAGYAPIDARSASSKQLVFDGAVRSM